MTTKEVQETLKIKLPDVKPQRATVTVQQHISQMGVLNDHVRHLPTLKDSPKAVPAMRKGNVLFGKADLAAIVLERYVYHHPVNKKVLQDLPNKQETDT